MGTIIETFHGKIPNTNAAAIIFEACRLGVLDRTHRRLLEEEKRSIRGGEVFVFAENLSGIKRWTDGKNWSPSRVVGDFLVYFELDTRIHNVKRTQELQPTLLARIEKEDLKVQIGNKGTFIYRKNGLIKKTISLNSENDVEHMIIYESPLDTGEKLFSPKAYVELSMIQASDQVMRGLYKPSNNTRGQSGPRHNHSLVSNYGSDDANSSEEEHPSTSWYPNSGKIEKNIAEGQLISCGGHEISTEKGKPDSQRPKTCSSPIVSDSSQPPQNYLNLAPMNFTQSIQCMKSSPKSNIIQTPESSRTQVTYGSDYNPYVTSMGQKNWTNTINTSFTENSKESPHYIPGTPNQRIFEGEKNMLETSNRPQPTLDGCFPRILPRPRPQHASAIEARWLGNTSVTQSVLHMPDDCEIYERQQNVTPGSAVNPNFFGILDYGRF
ncbi:hypothetical protein G9A89_010426 [Geosiphon pyriformis]|nr:hypothetical protein G9A89_010426 [Geosiphon pyriformis]